MLTISRCRPSPNLIPLPDMTADIDKPVRLLNSDWTYMEILDDRSWNFSNDTGDWVDVDIPGHQPKPTGDQVYRTQFFISRSDQAHSILLRFEALNGYCDLYLNGRYVCSHFGSFVCWDVDITAFVQIDALNTLTVKINHTKQKLNPYDADGIIRPVYLVVVPEQHLCLLHTGVDFDPDYRNADIKIFWRLTRPCQTTVTFTLKAPDGRRVFTEDYLCKDTDRHQIDVRVDQPEKWDAEHPHLYRLEAEIKLGGRCIERVHRQVGFRSVKTDGGEILVNGTPIKLRGVTLVEMGRDRRWALTPEEIERDVELLKDANINFVSAVDAIPSPYFLDICDQKGLYVQQGVPLVGIGQQGSVSADDPEWLSVFLDSFTSMIAADYSRPSVILWSLGNESVWGENFRQMRDYAKQMDFRRPLSFNRPITIHNPEEMVDIWSVHHSSWDKSPSRMLDNRDEGEAFGNLPVLHDMYAHVPCYDVREIKRDPAIHDFWGEALLRRWKDIYNTKGALGGAIHSAFDKRDSLTEEKYTQWGIWDIWRRPRPEYWHTRCVYAPVWIKDEINEIPVDGTLRIRLENRYNHTNLRELSVCFTRGNKTWKMQGPDIPPLSDGELFVDLGSGSLDDSITLKFIEPGGRTCAAYLLGKKQTQMTVPQFAGAPAVIDEGDSLLITGDQFELSISKETGLIASRCNQHNMIESGPYLHLDSVILPEWKLEDIVWTVENSLAKIYIQGTYGAVKVAFILEIDCNGLMKITYRIKEIPFNAPAVKGVLEGIDKGGYGEVGICFVLNHSIDILQWRKNGQWSIYPDEHIGRSEGTAYRNSNDSGSESDSPMLSAWRSMEISKGLYGPYDTGNRGTNDFRAAKTNYYEVKAISSSAGAAIAAYSNGSGSARFEVLLDEKTIVTNTDTRIRYSGCWTHHKDAYGCYRNTESISNKQGSYAEIQFFGTGISWIGSKYLTYGLADIWLDGEIVAQGIDLYSYPLPSVPRGMERVCGQILYSITGLNSGEHALRIVVTGNKSEAAYNCYASVDYFQIFNGVQVSPIGMFLLDEWNYSAIGYGNYTKQPISVDNGYQGSSIIDLGMPFSGREEENHG